MKRVISFLLILSFIILPINAIGEINPSTESQSIWCRFYYTKWICDAGGAGAPGAQGEQGIPEKEILQTFGTSPEISQPMEWLIFSPK